MRTVLLFLLFASICHNAIAANSPMVYRYWDWSMTKSRDDYQVAALTLALEKTMDSHGSYDVIRVKQPLGNSRALRELQTGEVINLHAAPALVSGNSLTPATENVSVAVKVPLMSGLLGYRQLIVRKQQLEQFQKITSAQQLKSLVAGQGNNWEDVHIFRYNGYRVNDDGDYFALTNMLNAGRFDYLPMSIIESANVIAQAEHPEQFAIVDNLLLYYPLPLFFYVSKKYPQLAERLEKGLLMAQEDGSLEALLHAHFSGHIRVLQRDENITLLQLDNPSVAEVIDLKNPVFIKR